MNTQSKLKSHICDQCGLPFGRGGVVRSEDNKLLHFCCYGCSFTNTIVGMKGEAGVAGLFLARLGFSAFLSMNIMILSWVIYDKQWITLGIEAEMIPVLEKLLFVLATPIMLLVGYPYLKNMLKEIRSVRLSMDSLIAIGSFAAYIFSTYEIFTGGEGIYFDTGTMVIVLVTAGRYLEANAKIKTSNAISQLINLQPDMTRKVSNDLEEMVPTSSVTVEEVIKVIPGERVPLDGIIIEGTSNINEANLTGESVPRTKKAGDTVFAATMNIDGMLLIKTTALQQETIHSQVVRIMEEARRTRSPIQLNVDRIAALFIPVVIGLSLVTFIGWMLFANFDLALIHALTVLVVACPCALGIGTPLAAAIAIGYAAEKGVLIRSTAILEKLATTRNVVFDKTGTLTKGELTVSSVNSFTDKNEFLSVVASIEKDSEHFLGKSILEYVKGSDVTLHKTRNITALPGYGMSGEVIVDGKWLQVYIGNLTFLEKSNCQFPDGMEDRIKSDSSSRVYAGWNSTIQGWIEIKDTLRINAKDVIRSLHEQRINIVLLSGDSIGVTKTISEAVGIQQFFGELLPQDKITKIEALKKLGTIIMVGDGINDAPSLVAADVGVTLATATDIAKESSDVTILGDHLDKIPWLIDYSQKTLRTIRWNLFWAFGYNSIGIALAIAGLLQPVIAALAMIVSSLIIILNSRRLSYS